MSMHKIPCTKLEVKGLTAHGLARRIGKPDQLIDVFRQGVAWALNNSDELQTLLQRNAELESANETAQWCVRDKNQQILAQQDTINKMREALLLIKQRAAACGHQPMYRIANESLSLQPSTEKLADYGLTIHPKKIRIAPTKSGIPFLGYVIWQHHISAGAYIRRRYHHTLRQHESEIYDRSQALNSYRAALMHTGSTVCAKLTS